VGHIERGAYKMTEKLKDILKLPFKVTAYLYGGSDIEVSVRLPEHKRDLKYKLRDWIADALNEKIGRDLAEPLQAEKTEPYSITFEEFNLLLDRKYYFTKERFYSYFNMLCVIECKNLDKLWLIWESFPYFNKDDIEDIAFIVEKLLLYPHIEQSFNSDSYRIYNESKPNKRKIYYENDEGIKNFEIDFNDTEQVILYADFLKRNIEKIITAVEFIEEIYRDSKSLYVYDGDVFSVKDKWSKDKDGKLYACTQDGYKKLLYTKGKGYLRKGKPDYDDPSYNHHVITGNNKFYYIGNIYADPSFLIEQEAETEEGKKPNADD
jgi:hypothetical protein